VSKATKRHCAGTVQSQGGRVRNVTQVSFEPGPEDRWLDSAQSHILFASARWALGHALTSDLLTLKVDAFTNVPKRINAESLEKFSPVTFKISC